MREEEVVAPTVEALIENFPELQNDLKVSIEAKENHFEFSLASSTPLYKPLEK